MSGLEDLAHLFGELEAAAGWTAPALGWGEGSGAASEAEERTAASEAPPGEAEEEEGGEEGGGCVTEGAAASGKGGGEGARGGALVADFRVCQPTLQQVLLNLTRTPHNPQVNGED